MNDRPFFPATHLPVLVFGSVYGVTSLIGILLLWIKVEPFTALVEYFSGVSVPSDFTTMQHWTLGGLAVGAPLALALGYHLALRFAPSLPAEDTPASERHTSPYSLALAAFLIMAVWVTFSIWQTGALKNLVAWSDQASTIAARYSLFENLRFFEFGAIYLFIPLAAAAVLSRLPPRGWISHKAAVPFAMAAIAVGLNILLFQKRTAVIAALLILSAVAITQATTWLSRRVVVSLSLGAISLSAIIYFGLVLAPAMSQVTPPKQSLTPVVLPSVAVREMAEPTPVDALSPAQNLAAFAILSPISRTSVPALFYVTTYPEKHDFYGLDIGQDILGVGQMPDDAHVVWREMYPSLSGSSTASFQFVLYSQVGLLWALAISLAVGAALGVSWKWVVLEGVPGSSRQALLGSVILLACLYLAMDGLRTSLLSSYGLVWAWLFVLLLLRVSSLIGRRAGNR